MGAAEKKEGTAVWGWQEDRRDCKDSGSDRSTAKEEWVGFNGGQSKSDPMHLSIINAIKLNSNI